MKRFWLPVAAVAATALALGCATPQPPGEGAADGAPKRGGQLNMRVSVDPIDWDPTSHGGTARTGQAQGHNSLLGFKSGPDIQFTEMVVVPQLAERWEVSPDARTFTFYLRKGVKFANLPPVNGRELTAADVKWTVAYYTRTGEFADKNLPAVVHAGVFYQGFKGVEAPERYTVSVEFEEPFVPFLSYAASSWNPIVPREIYDADGHLKDRVIGTGPYQLDPAASQRGTRWVWKKNPAAWQADRTFLDEIRWLVLPQEAMAFAGFQTGQIDFLTGLPYRSFQEVQKANPQAVFLRYLQPRGYNLHFSQARGAPLTDVRVRRALVMAIDRDEINKISARGEGEWSPPGAMHGLFTEPEVRQLLKRDPEQARRLLAEAGYGSGLTLEWPFNNDLSQEDLAWFQLVQAQWSRVGVSANLVPMELVTHRAKRRAGDFDVDFSVALGALEGDADFMMTGSWHSKGSVNYNKVKDPELDKLLEAQRQEVDPEKRRERQRQAVRRLVDQAWSTAVIYPPKWDVVQPYLKGYYPRFSAHGPFVTAWLDK